MNGNEQNTEAEQLLKKELSIPKPLVGAFQDIVTKVVAPAGSVKRKHKS